MTVPRKVCLRLYQVVNIFSQSHVLFLRDTTCPVSSPPVGSVPGRPVSRHSRPRSRPGGGAVVRRKERRPPPDLAQRRLRLHEGPRSESGQDERPGNQAGHESRKHLDCPEARSSATLSRECHTSLSFTSTPDLFWFTTVF